MYIWTGTQGAEAAQRQTEAVQGQEPKRKAALSPHLWLAAWNAVKNRSSRLAMLDLYWALVQSNAPKPMIAAAWKLCLVAQDA